MDINNCPVCGQAGEVPGNPYEGLLRCPGREHPMFTEMEKCLACGRVNPANTLCVCDA